jgi:hypothetical protein
MKMTLQMEGDGPTGCMVIPKYVELRNSLDKKLLPLSTSDAIYPMLAKMQEKTVDYLNEALQCETLVMATLLHPFFRLKFFLKWFGADSAVTMNAESMLRRIYGEYELTAPSQNKSKSSQQKKASKTPLTSSPRPDILDSDSEDEPDIEESEDVALKNYLRGSDKMKSEDYDIKDPKSSLEWWKVSPHHFTLFYLV